MCTLFQNSGSFLAFSFTEEKIQVSIRIRNVSRNFNRFYSNMEILCVKKGQNQLHNYVHFQELQKPCSRPGCELTHHTLQERLVLPPGQQQTNSTKISGSHENEQLKVQTYTENSSLIHVVKAWVKVKPWSGPL